MAAQKKGSIAFLAGIVLAVILGLVSGLVPTLLVGLDGVIALAMIVLGLIAGLINIKDEHMNEFLVAVIAVTLVGIITVQQSTQLVPLLAPVVNSVFQNIVAFSAPAALVVGLKQVWALGTNSM